MVWSSFAEGKQLYQLAWILKCVWEKIPNKTPHVFKTHISAENIRRALESSTRAGQELHFSPGRSDECTGTLNHCALLFSLCSLYQLLFFLKVGWVRKLLTLLFLPSVFIWASLIGLNPATTNFLGTFDCYEMQWLSQATSKKEHILFVYWNLVNQGRKKKASERTHPTWKLSPSLWP